MMNIMKSIFNKILHMLFPARTNSLDKEYSVDHKSNLLDDQEPKLLKVANPDFFEQLKIRIQNSDDKYDYLKEAQCIKIDDAEFWYDYAEILRSLPVSSSMDLREKGSLSTADYASLKCYELSPDSAGAIGERILVLKMLTHGLSSMKNVGLTSLPEHGNIVERYTKSLESFRNIVIESVKKFPDDAWFQEQKNELEDDFGL